MSPVRESRIEEYFVTKVEEADGYAPKWGSNGHPDRVALFDPELVFLVELKRPFGGRLTRLQKRVFPKIEKRVKVYKLRTFADVDAFIYETVAQAKAAAEASR